MISVAVRIHVSLLSLPIRSAGHGLPNVLHVDLVVVPVVRGTSNSLDRAGWVARMAATPARLFATRRVLGLQGGRRVQNKPDMLCGSHETRLPSSWGRGGRGSPAGRRPVTLKWLSGRPLERNRHCHQTGTGSVTSLCHPCHLRVTQFPHVCRKTGFLID